MEEVPKPKVKDLREIMDDLKDYLDKNYPDLYDIILYLEDEKSGSVSHTFFDDTEGLVIAVERIIGGNLDVAQQLFIVLGDMLVAAGKMEKPKYMDS